VRRGDLSTRIGCSSPPKNNLEVHVWKCNGKRLLDLAKSSLRPLDGPAQMSILRPGEASINLLDSLAEKRFAEILIGGLKILLFWVSSVGRF
jgi:hypothetical protein